MKVRILVAVTHDGDYEAVGSSQAESDNEIKSVIADVLESGGYSLTWVEVELPAPTIETVDAQVAP